MNLTKKIFSGAISATIAFASFAPVVFADETIEGNGVNSTNTIVVTTNKSCNVSQSTKTSVVADLSASSNSGGNTATGNTGDGGVTIDTGTATSTVLMTITGGSNTADDPCCCAQAVSPSDRLIKDNGKDSSNTILDTTASTMSTSQKSKTEVLAALRARSRSGKNKASNNTGTGLVEVLTGNTTSSSTLGVSGGSNNLP